MADRRKRLSLAEARRTGRMTEFAAQAEAEGISPIGEEAFNDAVSRLNDGLASLSPSLGRKGEPR
jgi:hypothetical protein